MPYFALIIMFYHVKIACYHPLLSLSSISSKEAIQGYLESCGELRSIDFTSISRYSSSKTFKVIKSLNSKSISPT